MARKRAVILHISLDRDLPISISAQLKGQIEYGIASGALKPGQQLPSVRELAATEGVAPVTVSHVYSALKREGLIAVRPGMGTYVADHSVGARAGEGLVELQRLVDTLVGSALERGFSSAQISHMVTARLAGRMAGRPRIALVGVFGHATAAYAREVRALLADLDPEVTPSTIERLRTSEEERTLVCNADLILTLANRVKEVQGLLPRSHPLLRGLTFVVHEETVARLRLLPEGVTLGVVSTFAEFLPTMLQGIGLYITFTRPPLCAVLSDVERVNAVLAQAEALVYATGSETIVSHVSRTMPVVEYLHAPEPSSVLALHPLLERLFVSRRRGRGYTRERKGVSKVG